MLMKKIFTLLAMAIVAVAAMAQNGPMYFVGESTFGGTFFGQTVSQNNASDTIVFKITSITEFTGEISLPALTFNEMGTTIPAFTIHNAKFSFDGATRDATFGEQEISEAITIKDKEGKDVEKAFTGKINSAKYTTSTQTFEINVTFKYGSMPGEITYVSAAKYDKGLTNERNSTNGIKGILKENDNAEIYDILGQKTTELKAGRIYIKNGRKMIVR